MRFGLGKNPLIVGLGKTGESCVAFCRREKINFHALDSRSDCDSRSELMKEPFCRSLTFNGFEGGLEHHKQRLKDLHISSVIVSPGLDPRGVFFDACRELQLEILGDIELYARAISNSSTSVIAITGSNGKTTVTQWLGDLLAEAGVSVAIGGNIGTPALDLLEQANDWVVLELSSFQLETTRSLNPVVATVLNICADHLDRYDSFEDYRQIKLHLLDLAQHQVIDCDELPQQCLDYSDAQKIGIEQCQANIQYQAEDACIYFTDPNGAKVVIDTKNLKVPGMHNIRNLLTVIALAQHTGLNWTDALTSFVYQWPGLEHRCAFVAEHDGVRYYNDSKATNVGATLAAIQGFMLKGEAKIVLIAGGDGKGVDFSPMADTFEQCLRALVLLGKDALRLKSEAAGALPVIIVESMLDAVTKAKAYAQSGDVVLLSPACASLDMYKNYMHRGDVFCQAVEALQ